MGKIDLQKLIENAKILARKDSITEEDSIVLIDQVMEYLFTTGNKAIKAKYLNVDIDFIKAKIKSFYLFGDDGRKINLIGYTQKFTEQLALNQKEGIRKLSKDIFNGYTESSSGNVLVFGKN